MPPDSKTNDSVPDRIARVKKLGSYALISFILALTILSGCHSNPQGTDTIPKSPSTTIVAPNGNNTNAASPKTTGSPKTTVQPNGVPAIAAAIGPSALSLIRDQIETTAPIKGGAGVIVCEPIVNRADEPTAAFGTGCARLLNFEVGGQLEFGKTPVWDAADRARMEMKRADLRLTVNEAAEMRKRTGVTHLILTEIQGSAKDCALTCALIQTSDRKRVGKTMSARGTYAYALTRLLGLAKELAIRLGSSKPNIPAKVEATAAEMQMLGRLSWKPAYDLPEADKMTLETLAPRIPLAAIMAIESDAIQDRSVLDSIAKSLLNSSGGNAAVYGSLALHSGSSLTTCEKCLSNLSAQYPANYQIATARVLNARISASGNELQAAQAVRDNAPDNPDAWLTIGYTVGEEANKLRKGRYSQQISPAEYSALDKLYADWVKDLKQATLLDPEYAKAWARLATAATFAGDRNLADSSLWKAFALDKGSPEAIEWGLQMYQPKWSNDPDKLIKVAYLAAEAYHYDSRAIGVANKLKEGGQEAEARKLKQETMKRLRAAAQQRPNDFKARYDLAWSLKDSGNLQETRRALKALIKQFPTECNASGSPHYDLADCLTDLGRFPESIAEFQLFLRKNPDSAKGRMGLGYAFRHNREPLKAIAELQKGIALDKTNFYNGNEMLGDAYLDARLFKEAVASYQKELKKDPTRYISIRNMGAALSYSGHYAEAVHYGEMAVQAKPEDMEAHMNLSYAYGMNKQHEESAREYRTVLQADPNNPIAHGNLGDALIELKQRAEARVEWETALKLATSRGGLEMQPVIKEAKEMLAKYP